MRSRGLAIGLMLILGACGVEDQHKQETSTKRYRVAVTWTASVGVTPSGNSLSKTSSNFAWDAGAVSTQSITGDGYVQFTTAEANTHKMLGLSNGDTDQSYSDIDFAIYLAGSGTVYIYEGGTKRAQLGTYAANDVFRVEVSSNVVTYYQNGTAIYTSSSTPTFPLLVDTSILSQNATLNNVNLETATFWQNVVDLTTNGTSLQKTGGSNAWTAGAVTTGSLTGNGYVEFSSSENNTNKMIGLSHGDTDQSYSDIDFAIYLAGSSTLRVYEGGTQMGVFGSYAANDVFRIQVTGTTITYLKNGTVFYTSTATPTFPLLVDSSVYTIGATINNVTLAEESFYQRVTGVAVNGTTITKIAAPGWDAGASSVDSFTGNGYVEFSTAESFHNKMAGLTATDSDQTFGDIDFAIYLAGSGNVSVYEGGVKMGTFGSYVAGDTFRVESSGGAVTYYHNNTPFYVSTNTPASTLRMDTSLYETGATITNASIGTTAASYFQNVTGVIASGNNLTKTTDSGWNAGASTAATLAADGYLEFTTAEVTTNKMCGLSNGDSDQTYSDIDFAIYLAGSGNVSVYESGVKMGTFGTYAANDVFRITVTGTTVTYAQNGTTFYTSTATPTAPLGADTSLYERGATLNNIVLTNAP